MLTLSLLTVYQYASATFLLFSPFLVFQSVGSLMSLARKLSHCISPGSTAIPSTLNKHGGINDVHARILELRIQTCQFFCDLAKTLCPIGP